MLEKEPSFLYVSQDGASIIAKETDPNIMGLWTGDIQNCIVLMGYGKEDIFLIHATVKMSMEEISSFLSRRKSISKIYIYSNDQYKASAEDTLMTIGLQSWLDKNLDKKEYKLQRISRSSSTIGIKRNSPENPLLEKNEILTLPQKYKKYIKYHLVRDWINITNNFFLNANESAMIDYQYDGFEFKPLPRIIKTSEEIEKNRVLINRNSECRRVVDSDMLKINTVLHKCFNLSSDAPSTSKLIKILKQNGLDGNEAITQFEQWIEAMRLPKAQSEKNNASGHIPFFKAVPSLNSKAYVVQDIDFIPSDAEGYKIKGNKFFNEKNYHQALNYYDKAIELDQNFKEAWLNKAKTHYWLKDKENALMSAQKAQVIDPKCLKVVTILDKIKSMKLEESYSKQYK